jgi:acyl-CoA thioester hydrolase
MNEFKRDIQIRWSDIDANFHLRHSVYYDWGAFCRMEFLTEQGLGMKEMMKLKIGPILFREEAVFRKEIHYGDAVTMNLRLLRSKKDFSRWSFQHQVFKNGDTLCAVITVDGAWMDVVQRKLASPPEEVHHAFEKIPLAEGFEWL